MPAGTKIEVEHQPPQVGRCRDIFNGCPKSDQVVDQLKTICRIGRAGSVQSQAFQRVRRSGTERSSLTAPACPTNGIGCRLGDPHRMQPGSDLPRVSTPPSDPERVGLAQSASNSPSRTGMSYGLLAAAEGLRMLSPAPASLRDSSGVGAAADSTRQVPRIETRMDLDEATGSEHLIPTSLPQGVRVPPTSRRPQARAKRCGRAGDRVRKHHPKSSSTMASTSSRHPDRPRDGVREPGGGARNRATTALFWASASLAASVSRHDASMTPVRWSRWRRKWAAVCSGSARERRRRGSSASSAAVTAASSSPPAVASPPGPTPAHGQEGRGGYSLGAPGHTARCGCPPSSPTRQHRDRGAEAGRSPRSCRCRRAPRSHGARHRWP